MKVLAAMSGGVDSSVAAALLLDAGHDVVGVTMKLWGGDSDTGCCSVSDVDDARRVAQQLDIDHLVFNFGEDFERHVVDPYADAHARSVTPNPCVECNRHLKFDRLLRRAELLGFDAVATGHHARVERGDDGRLLLGRGVDAAKDQSYVVHMLDQASLARTLFPVGELEKAAVRRIAAERGLRTAAKPDSQDVCFITSSRGRHGFLAQRMAFHRGSVVDTAGAALGEVEAVELVTIGQRRGIGLPGGGPKRYVVDVDVDDARRVVVVGDARDLQRDVEVVEHVTWTSDPADGAVRVQCSAHGDSRPARLEQNHDAAGVVVRWERPQPRVAPGQSVVFYDESDRYVLGGGVAAVSREASAGRIFRPAAAPGASG